MHLALNMIIVIEIMLIIIKKYLINLSKCDPVTVSGWFSCTTRSLDHFTWTPCCKIVHSCSTECRNKITGIIMKVVRSLQSWKVKFQPRFVLLYPLSPISKIWQFSRLFSECILQAHIVQSYVLHFIESNFLDSFL